MIFVLGIVNCHIKNNMLMAVAMFVVTYVSVICSAYNILAQWQKLFSEQKYIRLSIIVGHSIIVNVIFIIAGYRAIFY